MDTTKRLPKHCLCALCQGNALKSSRSRFERAAEIPTCDVDINGGEGGERHRRHVLRPHPEVEEGCGLVVQRLRHQDGRRAVLAVRGEVEPDGHVGLGHHAVLQVVGHPGVAQLGRRLDGLDGMGEGDDSGAERFFTES